MVRNLLDVALSWSTDTPLLDQKPSLLIFSALGVPPFRSIKLRSRKASCPACGTEGEKVGQIRDIDYVQFCGGAAPDWESRGMVEGRSDRRIRVQVGSLCLYIRSALNFTLS